MSESSTFTYTGRGSVSSRFAIRSDYYLVDPFLINDDIIVKFLTLKNMLYMFFAADSDRSLVYKQYKLKMNAVYDLQYLVEVLDLPSKGLDAVLLSELGITVRIGSHGPSTRVRYSTWNVVELLPLGYPADPSPTEKSRKGVSEILDWDYWGENVKP